MIADISYRYVRETGEAFDDIGKLMQDFHCKSSAKMQFEELADGVRHFKETEEVA